MTPRCSIVQKEMQRWLSSTPGFTSAPVGQTRMQASHVPQLFFTG